MDNPRQNQPGNILEDYYTFRSPKLLAFNSSPLLSFNYPGSREV